MAATFSEQFDGIQRRDWAPGYFPSQQDAGRYTRSIEVAGHTGEDDELVAVAVAAGYGLGHAHPRIPGFVALTLPNPERIGPNHHRFVIEYGRPTLLNPGNPDQPDQTTDLYVPYSVRRPVLGSRPVRFDRSGNALGYETQALETRTELVVVGYHTTDLYEGLWEVIKNRLNNAIVEVPPARAFRSTQQPTTYGAGTMLAKTYQEEYVEDGVLRVEFLFDVGVSSDFQAIGEVENADGTVSPTTAADIYPEAAFPQADLWDLSYWDTP